RCAYFIFHLLLLSIFGLSIVLLEPATTPLSTLSLHDALPISRSERVVSTFFGRIRGMAEVRISASSYVLSVPQITSPGARAGNVGFRVIKPVNAGSAPKSLTRPA